ncbi:hypothetical protein B0H16DRAFT_1449209 [Mycena metata]|uniref:Uncharacterized protein n=1 Tax=Mycena metata TaxID=1033252 RepID=A0AAD7K5G1_9AGAR|nr:hypothetical protein B0H16DRAFT_1449209 [Mycena metata]
MPGFQIVQASLVFEHMFGGLQFCTIPHALRHLQLPQYALLPSINFLCLLCQPPESVNVGIKLSAADSLVFKRLDGYREDVIEAVKAFGAKKKKGRGEVQDIGSEDENSD